LAGAPDAPEGSPASGLVEHFFRHSYGRLVAVLAGEVGVQHVDRVEDAVQAALMAALSSWIGSGVPDDPAGWLYRVARNDLLGALRKDAGRLRILEAGAGDLVRDQVQPVTVRFDAEVSDDLLRMLFICCDDSIPPGSRLVLALKTLCGFSTAEIALRLFTSEANVLKRLGRARERLRAHPPDLDVLAPEAVRSRLPSVHLVLYLLFNEGYLSATSDRMVRRELCEEAIRLATLLARHPVGATPETFALLALMHLHAARLAGRLDEAGALLVLESQDRSQWDADHLRMGAEWLQKSAVGASFTRFHAEAGIAAEHAFAPSFAETRWGEIAGLYDMLEQVAPSPLNALNRAVVVAEWQGPEAALALLERTERPDTLKRYHLWDAVLGELHRRAGHREEARRSLERALDAAPTDAECSLLRQRIESL
jgi:RNA polymerase sigma factor (sigma-70 family)